MTAEGHLLFSVACAIFAKKAQITPQLAKGDWWQIIPAALFSSLLPDLDHPQSSLGRRIRWISVPLSRLFGHRGFTHSLLAVFGCSVLFYENVPYENVIPADVLQATVVGYCSHLLADMCTPAGIPLFWPYRRRIKLLLINTLMTKSFERVLCLCLVIYSIYWRHNDGSFSPF